MEKSIPLSFLFLFAVSSFSSVGGQTQRSPTPTSSNSVIVIEDGTLIDGTGRPPTTETTILIEGNRIREIGKYADLVILDADPLQDIRHTRNIHRVIKDGKILDPARLLEDNIRQFGERGERPFDRTRPE